MIPAGRTGPRFVRPPDRKPPWSPVASGTRVAAVRAGASLGMCPTAMCC